MTRKLTGQSVLPARVPAVNWQLYGELADIASSLPAIGNNINQIALTLNTAQKKGEAIPQSLPSLKLRRRFGINRNNKRKTKRC